MSHKVGILSRSILEGKVQNAVGGKVPILVLGLSALALAALVMFAALSGTAPTAVKTGIAPLPVANPELMAAHRYANGLAQLTETSFLASSPELQVFHRYNVDATGQGNSEFLASNPEIKVLRRHAAEKTGQ